MIYLMFLPTETVRVLFVDQLLQHGRTSDDVTWVQDVWLGKRDLGEDALAA